MPESCAFKLRSAPSSPCPIWVKWPCHSRLVHLPQLPLGREQDIAVLFLSPGACCVTESGTWLFVTIPTSGTEAQQLKLGCHSVRSVPLSAFPASELWLTDFASRRKQAIKQKAPNLFPKELTIQNRLESSNLRLFPKTGGGWSERWLREEIDGLFRLHC